MLLLGSAFISTYYNKKGKSEGNSLYIKFARDVIEKLTISKSAELALGTIPVISAFFAYVQLLYAAHTIQSPMVFYYMIIVLIIFLILGNFIIQWIKIQTQAWQRLYLRL